MSNKDVDRRNPKGPQVPAPSAEDLPSSRPGAAARGVLIFLVGLTVVFLTLCQLNSYDVWTHLATGRLMWEERRIPDHEPYSYTQNREMSLEEAAPQFALRRTVFTPAGRLVVAAGVPFDDAAKAKLRRANIPLESVELKIESPLKRLVEDATEADGMVVATKGALLDQARVETLRSAGVKTVHVTVPWVNHEWLFQIIAYLSYKCCGLDGPIYLQMGLLSLAFFFVFLTAYRPQTHLVGLAAVFLAAITSYKRFYMRPELFSILFTAVWIWMIERFRRRGRGWSLCITAPLLMVLWINTHGYFILGIAVMLIYLIGEGLQDVLLMSGVFRKASRFGEDLIRGKGLGRLAVATALCVLATLVNPYGVAGARYPIDVLQQVADPTSVIRTVIGEMQPTFNFGHIYAVTFTWVLVVLGVASCVLNVRRIKLSRLLLGVLSYFFMTKALRNMPFFGIPGAMILALNVNEAWPDVLAYLRRKVPSEALLAAAWAGQLGLAALLGFFIVWIPSDRFYVNDVANVRFGFGYSVDKFSMGATDFIRDNPVQGHLFNAFGMGGLCMWKLFPEERPGPDGKPTLQYGGTRLFIDGRAELYGGPFVRDYTFALMDNSTWNAFDEKFKFQEVFLNWQAVDTQPLIRRLYRDPAWALCYGDGVGYVFVRNTPENKAVIDKARKCMESPPFIDFAEPYARPADSLPGIPSRRRFADGQDRIWNLCRTQGGDPRLGEQARRLSDTPGQAPLDRRLMTNAYDRLREWLPVLPERVICPGEVLGQAEFALNEGYPDLADALVSGLIELSPEVPDFYLYRGRIYQVRAENLLHQGYTKQGESDFRMAMEYYRQAENRAGNYPGLNLEILRLADRMGDGRVAALYLRRCMTEVYPAVPSAEFLGSICMRYNLDLEAIEQFRTAAELLPERDRSELYERIAFCHVRLHDYRSALPNATRAVDLDESNPLAWMTLGLTEKGLGRLDRAKEAFQRCLALSPDFQAARDQLRQLESSSTPPPAFR